MGSCHSTDGGTVTIIQKCGAFDRVQEPGCTCLILPCCYEQVAGTVSLRIQQHDIMCNTKTLDNVFVNVKVSVQFKVKSGLEKDSFYRLTNPRHQIESYVYDSLRAEVPRYTLDDVFVVKDKLSSAVRQTVEEAMTAFGFEIIATPVTDIDPDAGVKASMNEMQRQKRLKKASEEKGEAQKILTIKEAEARAAQVRIEAGAQADAAELQGQGLSRQRQAIADGLQKSVASFTGNVPGTSAQDVMDLIMMSQYYETLKDIGGTSKSSTVFVPMGPNGARADMASMRQGVMEGLAGSKEP